MIKYSQYLYVKKKGEFKNCSFTSSSLCSDVIQRAEKDVRITGLGSVNNNSVKRQCISQDQELNYELGAKSSWPPVFAWPIS